MEKAVIDGKVNHSRQTVFAAKSALGGVRLGACARVRVCVCVHPSLGRNELVSATRLGVIAERPGQLGIMGTSSLIIFTVWR